MVLLLGSELYIRVTVHRNRFIFNNQPDALITASKQNQMEQSSILTLLDTVIINLHEAYQCRMYSRVLLMMGREVARNM
jgi:hypothetical protein